MRVGSMRAVHRFTCAVVQSMDEYGMWGCAVRSRELVDVASYPTVVSHSSTQQHTDRA